MRMISAHAFFSDPNLMQNEINNDYIFLTSHIDFKGITWTIIILSSNFAANDRSIFSKGDGI